ncbi:MAG TPA: hypothetical protein VIG24_19295 [Acidimicrobiia bacterium]
MTLRESEPMPKNMRPAGYGNSKKRAVAQALAQSMNKKGKK